METWDLTTVDVQPRQPHILATNEARAIIISLPAGEELQEHEVHEHAWVSVVSGSVDFIDAAGAATAAGAGALAHFAPHERHSVRATSDARLLLLLAPWPGAGHPGQTPLEEKRRAPERAAEINNG